MGFFDAPQKQPQPTVRRDYEKELRDMEHEHKLEVSELKSQHTLALKEKEFELKHFKDAELLKAKEALAEKEREVAVLKKENEMLAKITNLNADLIDIKDLVQSLIKKLPEINLKNLTINGPSK